MTIEGQPWFVAKDVCVVLHGAKGQRNPTHYTRYLDADEKGVQIVHTPGGPQRSSIISESGLYTLIMRSNKPEAQAFRKWVTSVVLPAILKDGGDGARKVAPKDDQAPGAAADQSVDCSCHSDKVTHRYPQGCPQTCPRKHMDFSALSTAEKTLPVVA